VAIDTAHIIPDLSIEMGLTILKKSAIFPPVKTGGY